MIPASALMAAAASRVLQSPRWERKNKIAANKPMTLFMRNSSIAYRLLSRFDGQTP
jgi:hypothetical protein